MNAVRDEATDGPAGGGKAPEGRYGRSADEQADHKLKILGAVLGVLLLLLVGWLGYGYISKQKISAELIKFDLKSSDTEVNVHLEIRKDKDATGTCTVRALAENGTEVGRKDVRITQRGTSRIDELYPIRTTSKATSAELLSCTADGQ